MLPIKIVGESTQIAGSHRCWEHDIGQSEHGLRKRLIAPGEFHEKRTLPKRNHQAAGAGLDENETEKGRVIRYESSPERCGDKHSRASQQRAPLANALL